MQKRKLTSWFLTICLLVTQILTPDISQAASLAFAPAQTEAQFVEAWQPPALFGKVTRRVFSEKAQGTLIHIQDAHAVFEAQKNIQALIGEVKRVSAVENIFIEGGAGELDPQLKHFFPDGLALNPENREAWMKEGHLTGAEAYLMENARARGFGIEEMQSYWSNVELYRRVDSRRADCEAFLRAWYEAWQKLVSKIMKPALKRYLEVYARAQSDGAASASWFDALRDYLKSEWDRDLSSAEEQVEFPMLARYIYLKKIDAASDYSKVEKQKQDFFESVRARSELKEKDGKLFSEIDVLIEKTKTNQIDLSGAREVFEQLAAYLPADFSMSRWPDLKTLIEKIILAGEMDPEALLNEARRLHKQIIKKDTPLKAQRELALLLEKQILLRKLFNLELTREDFQKILNHPARPEMLVQQLPGTTLIWGNEQKGLAALSQVYDDAILFYRGAIERESGMRQAIQGITQKNQVSVVVTGGFHAEGMQSFAREQKWNYVAVMPRISKIQPEDFAHYRRALLGEGSARSEMRTPSEVAAALITSPQVMRDPHAAERSEAVLSLPGAAEAMRKMESHVSPRDDKNSSRMKRSATRPRQSDKPMNDWEGLSRPVARSETRLQEAVEKIREWKLSHKDILLQPSEADPFESLLEKEARWIYQQKKLHELSVADRTRFVQAVFGNIDGAVVQFAEGWIDKLTDEERQSALPLNYMTFSKVSRDMASLEHRYSMLQNQMIRTAGDLVFNLDSAEKRVLELEWILSQIDSELKRPGTGEIPVVLAMQDLHGGTRRALGLLAHAYGLPPDSFKRIKSLNDLVRLLDEKNMSLENLSGRIIGLNDLVDRGKDPVGSTELVVRLQKTEKGRFILGNHDLWRMMGALGVHHLFSREKEEDFLKEEKGHHAAWWSWEAFHHAGWGDIELDQRNQARFNYIVEEMNAYLRDKKADDQHFAAIDLGEVRAQMDEQLKKAKSKNKKLRTDWQIQSNDEKELAEKEKRPPVEVPVPEYEPLPDVFQATLAFLNEKTAAYTGRVMELRRKYPDFPGFEDFTALDLNNYDRDPEIVESVLFQLQNFRLFYIDMLGNLHMHNIIPFDQNGFKVNYKGQHGLAALELITKDIRTFFETVQVHDVIGSNKAEQNIFRQKMWHELGPAFEIMNEWYSDTIPVAKAQFVKKFVHEGDLSTLMGRTSGTFVDREVSGFVIWGHNELGKFADQDMSPWTFFEEFGSGILNIDGEMSQGYKDRGFLLTMGRRDANGRISGLKLWSYPEKEMGVDDSVVEEATHHLPDPIFKIRKEFENSKAALEKQIAELKGGQSSLTEVEAKEAELRTLQETYESYERRYQRQQVVISKLSDGETYLKWLQFKMLKELEELLAEAAESSSLPAEKKKNFAHRRQVAANLFKSAENPLAGKITGGSAMLFAQSPTAEVSFGPVGEKLHLEIHPAVSKKLEEAGVRAVPSVNEDELEKMYPSPGEYAANQTAYEMVNQNFEQIDRFRASHNAALADLSSSEEWSEDKVKHFFENMEAMLAANRNYTGLPENRENDKLVAQELDAKLQQLRADYLAAAVHGAGAVNQFFRQMQGIWGSVIGQQVSSIDTFNKLINFTHNRFSDRLMGGSEASRQARFMDLDHYLTRNDIAPQRARVSRFFNDRILRGLIGGPYDKTYQLIMRGSFFWLQKTLGVHKMQVYLDLSPPEFGGMGEIILYESGDDQGNILRRKLVARVLNQLGFETSEQDTQPGMGKKQLRLRAVLKKNQSVKTISDLFFRMQLALYFLNTIKEGDIYLEELNLFYSPDAMEKIINALVTRVLKTGGQFRITNNPRYLLGAVRQEKSEGSQIKEEVVPLLGHALDRRTADTPLGILTNTGGLDDHERIISAIKSGEGKWWSGAGPYEDIYQADFKKDGRKIYDAAVETLRALGLSLPPDYDPAKFGQIWLHEHVNQVIQRALASGEIQKSNGQFERVASEGQSVLAAPEWFLKEWGSGDLPEQVENQKQMILTARQMSAVPFEPNLVGRIGSAFLYQGQMEFLDHLVDIVVARDRYGKNIAAVLYENGSRLLTENIDQILGSVINMKEMDSVVQADEHHSVVEALEAPLTASVFLGEPLRGLPFLSGLKSGKAFFSAKSAHENRGILFLERAEHVDIRALESAQGLVTSTGNLLDHINTEARSYNKPRVGIHGGKIDAAAKKATLSKAIQEEVRATGSGIIYSIFKEADKATVIQEGDWVTLDGSTGMIYLLPKDLRVVGGLEKLTSLQISRDSKPGNAADLNAWLEQAARDENWDGIKLVLNELAMNASGYTQDLWKEVMLKIKNITDSHEDMTSYWAILKNYVWVDTWQAYERHLSGMASATRQDQLYYELSGARARLIAAEEFFKFLGIEDQKVFALKLKENKKKIRTVYFERMRLMRGKVLNALKVWDERGRPAFDGQDQNPPRFLLRRWIGQIEEFERSGFLFRGIWMELVTVAKRLFNQNQNTKSNRIKQAKEKRILPLEEVEVGMFRFTGYKAQNLGWLTRFLNWHNKQAKTDFKIAEGTVITQAVFEEFLKQPHPSLQRPLGQLINEILLREDFSEKIKAFKILEWIQSTPLPSRMKSEIEQVVGKTDLWATRSSTTLEDTPTSAAAGLFQSTLSLRGIEQVEKGIKTAWASFYSEKALIYRRGIKADEDFGQGVILQKMVDADYSGVITSAGMATEDRGLVVINAGLGLGASIVDAVQDADVFTYDRITGFIQSEAGDKTEIVLPGDGGVRQVESMRSARQDEEGRAKLSLTNEQVRRMAALAMALEEAFGYVVQAEFAIKDNQIYVMQVRPMSGFKILRNERNEIDQWLRSEARSEMRQSGLNFSSKIKGHIDGRLLFAGALILGIGLLQAIVGLAAFKIVIGFVGASLVGVTFFSAFRGMYIDAKKKEKLAQNERFAELQKQHLLRNQIWGALDRWPGPAVQTWIEKEDSAALPDLSQIRDHYVLGAIHFKKAAGFFLAGSVAGFDAAMIAQEIKAELKMARDQFRRVDYDQDAGVLLNALNRLELDSNEASPALIHFVEYFILARLRAQPRKAWANAPLPQGGYVLGNNPTQAELKSYPLPTKKNVAVYLLPGEGVAAFKAKPLYRDLRKNENKIQFIRLTTQDYTSRETLIAKLRSISKKKPFDVLIAPFAGLMPKEQNQYPAELQRYLEDAKDLYELDSGRPMDQIFYETDLVPTLANYFVQGDEQSTHLSMLSMGPEGHNSQRRGDKVGIYPGITMLMSFVAGSLGFKKGILKDDGKPILADAFYRTDIYGDERPQQPNEPSKPRRIFLVSPHPDDDVIAAKAVLAEAMKSAQDGEVVAEVIVMQPGENGVVDLNETQMKEALRLALGYEAGDLNATRVDQLKKVWAKNLNQIRALHENVLAEYKERYPAAAEKFRAKLETFKGVDFDALFDAAANQAWNYEELAKSGIQKKEINQATHALLKETAKYFIRRIENQRAIDFFNDAYPGKIRAQFFPEFLGYPSSGPQDLRFINELEEHAAVVMQHLLMKFELSMKDAPKDAVLTIVGPSGVDAHVNHVKAYEILQKAMRLWAVKASRQSERDVEVLYYFAPWSGNLPAYHLSPITEKATNADLLRALIAGELTASRFGLPSPKELQEMQAQRYLVRPSILPARSELRSKRQEKSTKAFIAATEALKKGDRRRFESERGKLEKLGMLVLAVGKSEFFHENWKTKRPRVYTRAEREEVLRLVTAKVKHTMTPQEKRQLRVTVESQILAIGEDEVGLIGVQNYAEDESSEFGGAHLQIVSASETVPVDSMMRQTASGFMNMTQYGGAKNLHYQAQHLWWIGTEAFTETSEKLHGGSFSEVHRFFNPDGSSYIVKTADPRQDGGKLLDEARMIQALPEDAAVYFPKILKIIETPEKTEVWMEDLQGASLTGLINSAPGMVHMGMQEDFLSFSPFTIARQIYSLLLGVFYARKQSETPAYFAEKFHFSKLEKRWSEAEAASLTFKKWMAAPYVKVSDHRGQMHLLPNFRMMLKIFRALAETYPNYFKPPYLSQQHGDLHFGNILVDIFEIISKKSISVGFKLIDPKWMKEGNDPLYDFAKLLHNLFGHYDLALDHSGTHHFRTGRGKSPDAPLEMSDYVDDEASGTMEMLERVRHFEIETWDFIRTHRGAAFPFEKDPLAWRIRLLFTEASLIAGLFKYHVVNDGREEKASILYERALTIFNNTIELFVSLQQDKKLIPTKDKKLRKALEAMIQAQQAANEPAFTAALAQVDQALLARSEARHLPYSAVVAGGLDWSRLIDVYRDREGLMNDPRLEVDFERNKKILISLFERRQEIWERIKTDRGEINADLFYQELLKWYQENESTLLDRLIESQSLLTLRDLNKAFAVFENTKNLSVNIRDRVLNLSRNRARESAELAKRAEQLKDLPALYSEWVRGHGNGERGYARMIKDKALEIVFKKAVESAYRKHYGLMEGVMREFNFSDYTKFRNLLRELEIETSGIELKDGDLLGGVNKTKPEVLKIVQKTKWNFAALQKKLMPFSQTPYGALQLIRGLGIVAEFKAEAQARVRAAGGIKTVDVPASFGIDKAIFKQLEDALALDLAEPSAQAEGFLTHAFGSKEQVLGELVALNWDLPAWEAAIEKRHPALSKMNGHVYFLRGYDLTEEFKAQYRQKFKEEKGNIAKTAKHFGVNPPTFRKILAEIDPPKPIQTTEDALEFLREHDWNIPALVKRIQTVGVGKGKQIEREFRVVLAPFNLREPLKAEVEARWRASYGYYGGVLRSFGFKNVAGSAFPEVLDLYKIKLDEKLLQPGDLLAAFGMTKEKLLETLRAPIAQKGWDWNLSRLFQRAFTMTDGRWHQADILRALNIEEEFRAEYAATRKKYYWSLDRVAERFYVQGGKNFAPLIERLKLPSEAQREGDLSLAFGWTPEEALSKLDSVKWNIGEFIRQNKDRLPHQQIGLANIFQGLGIHGQVLAHLKDLETALPSQNEILKRLRIEPPTYKKLKDGLASFANRSEMRNVEQKAVKEALGEWAGKIEKIEWLKNASEKDAFPGSFSQFSRLRSHLNKEERGGKFTPEIPVLPEFKNFKGEQSYWVGFARRIRSQGTVSSEELADFWIASRSYEDELSAWVELVSWYQPDSFEKWKGVLVDWSTALDGLYAVLGGIKDLDIHRHAEFRPVVLSELYNSNSDLMDRETLELVLEAAGEQAVSDYPTVLSAQQKIKDYLEGPKTDLRQAVAFMDGYKNALYYEMIFNPVARYVLNSSASDLLSLWKEKYDAHWAPVWVAQSLEIAQGTQQAHGFILSRLSQSGFRKPVARSEARASQPSAAQIMTARLFAAGFLPVGVVITEKILAEAMSAESLEGSNQRAQSMLGLPSVQPEDVFILGADLALDEGYFAVIEHRFTNHFTVIVRGEKAREVQGWINKRRLASRVSIANDMKQAKTKWAGKRLIGLELVGGFETDLEEPIRYTVERLKTVYKELGLLEEIGQLVEFTRSFLVSA